MLKRMWVRIGLVAREFDFVDALVALGAVLALGVASLLLGVMVEEVHCANERHDLARAVSRLRAELTALDGRLLQARQATREVQETAEAAERRAGVCLTRVDKLEGPRLCVHGIPSPAESCGQMVYHVGSSSTGVTTADYLHPTGVVTAVLASDSASTPMSSVDKSDVFTALASDPRPVTMDTDGIAVCTKCGETLTRATLKTHTHARGPWSALDPVPCGGVTR